MTGLSPAAFGHFFHKRTGKTFAPYVAEVRSGKACRHLMEADARILELAFACSFNNRSNFNRHFLKLKRMAPELGAS